MKIFKINCHLNRPRPLGQNVIVSQIGGNMTDSADDAIAPTKLKKKKKFISKRQNFYLRR